MGFEVLSFLAAFLLFCLQPFAAKGLTPWFGGGSHVWLTCLLCSQGALLAGYAYAHHLAGGTAPRRQGRIHALVLLGLTLAVVGVGYVSGRPLSPPRDWAPAASPVAGVLMMLAVGVGAPLLVLSATAPLLQAWFHARHPGERPYRLYATSNAGSLAGLLAYPFLLEPFLGLRAQAWVLAALLGAYVLGMVWVGRGLPEAPAPGARTRPVAARAFLAWLFLAFMGSLLLMAGSQVLSTELMGVPLIWVAPLVLYLLTYIWAFARGNRARTWRFGLGCAFVAFAGWLAFPWAAHAANPIWLLGPVLAVVGAGCLWCHGRLAASAPPAEQLTGFYLALALGGVLGGLAVVTVAPAVFSRHYEWPLAMLLLALVPWLGGGEAPRAFRVLGTLALGLGGGMQVLHEAAMPGISRRDVYGVVHVGTDAKKGFRFLLHGRTVHGLQSLKDPLAPAGYHAPRSGLGLAMAVAHDRFPALRLGVLGLGVGNVLAYQRPGDEVVCFEISPEVVGLAGAKAEAFTFVRDAPGRTSVRLGDGRALLAQEPGRFDVLLVDAFSGGNLPWHLLTREAFDTYLAHLAPRGLLVVNVTNRLPLDRLVLATARELGWAAAVVEWPLAGDPGPLYRHSVFVVLAREAKGLSDRRLLDASRAVVGIPGRPDASAAGAPHVWTDDRNSLSRLMVGR